MSEKKFNQEEMRNLIKKAIGARRQNDFSTISGVSISRLNHLLNDDKSGIPGKRTLEKIADASEGRVTPQQLLHACGYNVSEASSNENSDPREYLISAAREVKKGIEEFCGVATKYESLESMLETVNMLYAPARALAWTGESKKYTGKGRKGAERFAHCNVAFMKDPYRIRVSFTLFFCNTEEGGVIISDCAFDLATLLELENPDAGKFLFKIAESGDVCYTDYPMVARISKRDLSREEKLLKAIFGEDA